MRDRDGQTETDGRTAVTHSRSAALSIFMKSCFARTRISGSSLEGCEAKRQIWVSNTHTHERREYKSLGLIFLKHVYLKCSRGNLKLSTRAERVCLSICKKHEPKHTHTNSWNPAKPWPVVSVCDYEHLRCCLGVLGQCVRSKEFTQIANKTPEQVRSHYNPLWAKISQTNDFWTFRNFGSQNIVLPE